MTTKPKRVGPSCWWRCRVLEWESRSHYILGFRYAYESKRYQKIMACEVNAIESVCPNISGGSSLRSPSTAQITLNTYPTMEVLLSGRSTNSRHQPHKGPYGWGYPATSSWSCRCQPGPHEIFTAQSNFHSSIEWVYHFKASQVLSHLCLQYLFSTLVMSST